MNRMEWCVSSSGKELECLRWSPLKVCTTSAEAEAHHCRSKAEEERVKLGGGGSARRLCIFLTSAQARGGEKWRQLQFSLAMRTGGGAALERVQALAQGLWPQG